MDYNHDIDFSKPLTSTAWNMKMYILENRGSCYYNRISQNRTLRAMRTDLTVRTKSIAYSSARLPCFIDLLLELSFVVENFKALAILKSGRLNGNPNLK